MFDRVLPECIKPQKLARHGATLAGLIPAERLPNLLVGSLGARKPVEVELTFSSAEGVVALVQGRAQAEVEWQCQRCLEPVAVRLQVAVNIALVAAGEGEETLPHGFEALDLTAEEVALAELVEQDLILAAPIVPQHVDCSSPAAAEAPEEEPAEAAEAAEKNPFKDLAALLKGKSPQKL